jgi:cysteinyl-tRNA synthetase
MTDSKSEIWLYNTLTRQKEKFTPLETNKVRMYTCGPTVRNYAHIGNFRAFLFEDLLKRWLEYRGFEVLHVMNLTDVDDKTIKGSQAQQIPLAKFTEFYIKAFFEDVSAFNIEPAKFYPRATEHISEMVAMIKTLLDKGYAYRVDDGCIYFAVSRFSDYGKLSRVKVEDLKTGIRVKHDEYGKEEVQDFALWKTWVPEDGDVYWDTELGKGRPGWHIECSAMSMKYLGETFDIHCGGVDNIFPHHENEIAQSQASTGKKFVNFWLHNEHLLVEGKRMAKRFGNFYTLRDLLDKGYDPRAIRYLLLSTHYRQQFNFTFEALEASKGAIDRLNNLMRRLQDANGKGGGPAATSSICKLQVAFGEAMDDDLNVGAALAVLFDFVREINNLLDANMVSKEDAKEITTVFMDLDQVLGIIGKAEKEEPLPKEAEGLIKKREEARKAKDWKTADEIRQQLRSMGITIEDTSKGVRWKREKP